MIICWNEGQSSTIHDHADSHCFMKVLKGTLNEVKYSWPKDDPNSALISSFVPKCIGDYEADNGECDKEIQEISRSQMRTNDVFYINGK